MSATDRLRWVRALARPSRLILMASVVSVAGIALAADVQKSGSPEDQVRLLLKTRLPKTPINAIDCGKIEGLCEITAGSNLFYIDRGARFLVIGRVYDMQTRQDVTAARLLEINPDMLVGGAAKANAAADEGSPGEETADIRTPATGVRKTSLPAKPTMLSLAGLPKDGAIIWGNRAASQSVTVFTDFRCGYCRALTGVLRSMDIKVIERPISVLGSRDVADRVYCARNQEQALHAAYAGDPFKSGAACNTKGLDANEKFAHQHGLNGTPVIVRSDGAMLEGYRPKQFLEEWLKGAKS